MIRLLVVDDHPLFRAGVGALFDSVGRHRGAWRPRPTATAPSARRRSPARTSSSWTWTCPAPAAWRRPGGSCRPAPGTAVLVLTMLEDDDSVLAAMRAGARGYVVKGAGQEELLAAVRTVAAGGAVFGASVAAGLLQSLTAPPAGQPVPRADRPRGGGALAHGRGPRQPGDRRARWA